MMFWNHLDYKLLATSIGLVKVLLYTLKINHKDIVSKKMAPPIVNKAVVNAAHLQLFFKMRTPAAILSPLKSLPSEKH